MYTKTTPKYYNVIFLIFLLLYLFIVMFVVPNTEITMDRESYFISFANTPDIIDRMDFLSPPILFQEPLYRVIVYWLGIFFSPQSIALILIGISASLSIGALYKARPDLLPLIILVFFLPQFMGKYIAHIRQGLAISIFLVMYLYFKRSTITSCFIAGLAHISFFIALPILFAIKITPNKRTYAFLLSIVFFLSALFFFYQDIFRQLVFYLNIRQGQNYSFTSDNVSGLGFLYWFGIYIFLFMQKRYSESRALSMNIVALYCAGYFFVNFLSRLLESFLPMIFIELKSLNTKVCYLALTFYLIISWNSRLSSSLLGFGGS